MFIINTEPILNHLFETTEIMRQKRFQSFIFCPRKCNFASYRPNNCETKQNSSYYYRSAVFVVYKRALSDKLQQNPAGGSSTDSSYL